MTTPLAEAMRDALAAAARIGELYAPPEAARPVVYMALQGEPTCMAGSACCVLVYVPAAVLRFPAAQPEALARSAAALLCVQPQHDS
jgi:hypothetical protein